MGGRSHSELGDPSGFPVVYHHGTPSTGELPPWWQAPAAARGLRIIGFERSGYGGRAPAPGRRLPDVAAEAGVLADSLGLERFATMGVSGGGPFALATAAVLGGRVLALATVASPAPFDDAFDPFAGAGQANVDEFQAARRGRDALRAVIDRKAAALVASSPSEIADTMATLVSAPDRAVLDATVAGFLVKTMRDGLTGGSDGWVDDSLSFVEPWGFALDAISAPATIWQGRHDLMVPAANAARLAALVPGAELHLLDDEAHISLCWCHVEPIFDWLAAQRGGDVAHGI